MSTVDLQDQLIDNNLNNWFFLLMNGSPISWTRGRYSSEIDQFMRLVNSNMLDIVSSAYFIDFPSVSDYKPLVFYCMKTTTDESFFVTKKKKNLLCGIGIKFF